METKNDDSKIVIVCALKEEFAAVEAGLGVGYRERFELIRAGVGPASAARAAQDLSARTRPPKVIVSTGFCGGLSDGLNVGNIIAGADILSPDDRRGADVSDVLFAKHVCDSLRRAGLSAHFGRTICASAAVFSADEKRRLGKEYGAQAVDMESYALASNSNRANTRVIFVRAVSDSVEDELPPEVGDFLNEKGDVRLGEITRFIFMRPGNIKRLMELKRRSDIASKALTDAWRALRDMLFE